MNHWLEWNAFVGLKVIQKFNRRSAHWPAFETLSVLFLVTNKILILASLEFTRLHHGNRERQKNTTGLLCPISRSRPILDGFKVAVTFNV